jgi:hypothetical protein
MTIIAAVLSILVTALSVASWLQRSALTELHERNRRLLARCTKAESQLQQLILSAGLHDLEIHTHLAEPAKPERYTFRQAR